MNILQLSHDDILTGAGKACFRLHQLINKESQHHSKLMVANKASTDADVVTEKRPLRRFLNRASPYLDQSVRFVIGTKKEEFRSFNFFQTLANDELRKVNPDILHLHWINHSFLKLQTLQKFTQPIFWTCHDLWPMLGTQHYLSPQSNDIWDNRLIAQKKALYAKLGSQLNFIAPSQWMKGMLLNSGMTDKNSVVHFPNLIDTRIFRPLSELTVRDKLKINPRTKIVLIQGYPSTEKRKGGDRIFTACHKLLSRHKDDVQLHFFSDTSPQEFEAHPQVFNHGQITNELDLIHLYNMADVFIHLARQDNLPNTILEAHACGTPTIAFNVGGISDLYPHSVQDRLLLSTTDISDLVEKVMTLLAQKNELSHLSKKVREHVEKNFSKGRLKELFLLYRSAS